MRLYLYPILLLLFLILTSSNNKPIVKNIEINNYSLMDSVFNSHKTDSDNFVAPVYINNISKSIRDLSSSERKHIFIRTLLSNVIKSNNDITIDRNRIILLKNSDNISVEDSEWLNNQYYIYQVNDSDINSLINKVDIIPPSMAISQAVIESGWGTSRFAIDANSLFGEHFSKTSKGKYISAKNANVRLRAFDTIYEAVKGYSFNINRHRAYKNFRKERTAFRSENKQLNSLVLVNTLDKYSAIGNKYIIYLKQVINKNSLQKLDNLKIEDSGIEYHITIKQ